MNLRSLIIFLFAGGLVSCVSAGGDPPQAGGGPNMAGDPSVQELSCADFFESDTAVGRLSNNVWNKQAAGKSASRQCIMTRGPAPTHQYGWSWSWPLRSNTVFAYPETVIGWKPWSGGPSTHPRLPIRVAAINSFKWTYDLETAATGKYNLATSLWVTRTGVTSVAPNPADISTELMIWTDGYEFAPGGAKQAESMIGGIVFEIWYAANWRDASNTNSNRWTYVAYRAKTPRLSASLDIKKILDDAVARGLVSPDHFVSNIELGNEVMSGTGQTWIKSLALDVQ